MQSYIEVIKRMEGTEVYNNLLIFSIVFLLKPTTTTATSQVHFFHRIMSNVPESKR
jgi:hypothetical protein